MRRPSLALLGLVLLVAVAGCAPSGGEPETRVVEVVPARPNLSYLTGSWAVTTELTSIDNAEMTAAATQPDATWECAVIGDEMTLVTDKREYVGTLTPEPDDEWVYAASTTYADEDGHTWTVTIEVRGMPTDVDLASWAGVMTASIDSDVDGHLYTATWDLTANRI